MADMNVFPAEVIAKAVSFLTAFDVGSLWLCGDVHLMIKLSTVSITLFVLTYQPDGAVTWPSMIKNFAALEELVVRASGDQDTALPVRGVNLHDIPPSVKRIRLDGH